MYLTKKEIILSVSDAVKQAKKSKHKGYPQTELGILRYLTSHFAVLFGRTDSKQQVNQFIKDCGL